MKHAINTQLHVRVLPELRAQKEMTMGSGTERQAKRTGVLGGLGLLPIWEAHLLPGPGWVLGSMLGQTTEPLVVF